MVWLGAFVFPKAFLTSVILERVYKDRISPRKLCLDFYPLQSISNSPKNSTDGKYYITGLYFENARWEWGSDGVSGKLIPGDPIDLYQPAPIFVAQPILKLRDVDMKKESSFKCPLYKTFLRAGRMSTNGQSDNFITFIPIPLEEQEESATWRFVGTALILQVDADEV